MSQTVQTAAEVFTLNINMVQAVALAVVMYYLGGFIKKRARFLERYSIPTSVVGGILLAGTLSVLEGCGVLKANFDSTLQTVLMLAFFTTIGLMASLKLVINGGKLLLVFLGAVTVLSFLQNILGMSIAEMMGLDFHYGILAGSVSMMGGLGTSAAFGPYFEQTYGITGGTVVAITAATFGMVCSLMIGAPFGDWLIHRYKIQTPKSYPPPVQEPELHIPEDMKSDITEEHASEHPSFAEELMSATAIISVSMALGSLVSQWLGQFITLPAYIGSMIVAAVIRNFADWTGKLRVDTQALNAVAEISLVIFVTMAINSLKLHELVNLAGPLIVILAAQTVLMIIFAWAVLFKFTGKNYTAVMLTVGGIGFSMGATANGLANMQALAEKYGSCRHSWLIVSIVGAFLIDLINALIITWFGALTF